ncbi:thioredoxin family protein [Pricia sp.]|uniref:thioredoxin family protein n=1 Tax=Pricia sp. TaxID=2268138 RepID=UPI0035939D79
MKGNFEKIINGGRPVLVDFYAEWCGPCKAQSPIMADVAKEVAERARVIKIDIDKNKGIAQRYQVRGVPTCHLAFLNSDTFNNIQTGLGSVSWKRNWISSKLYEKIIELNWRSKY